MFIFYFSLNNNKNSKILIKKPKIYKDFIFLIKKEKRKQKMRKIILFFASFEKKKQKIEILTKKRKKLTISKKGLFVGGNKGRGYITSHISNISHPILSRKEGV